MHPLDLDKVNSLFVLRLAFWEEDEDAFTPNVIDLFNWKSANAGRPDQLKDIFKRHVFKRETVLRNWHKRALEGVHVVEKDMLGLGQPARRVAEAKRIAIDTLQMRLVQMQNAQ